MHACILHKHTYLGSQRGTEEGSEAVGSQVYIKHNAGGLWEGTYSIYLASQRGTEEGCGSEARYDAHSCSNGTSGRRQYDCTQTIKRGREGGRDGTRWSVTYTQTQREAIARRAPNFV